MSHTMVSPTSATMSDHEGSVMNLAYTRSLTGMLRISQVLVLLIAALCVACAPGWPYHAPYQYFLAVVLWFFFVLLFFLLMYIFRLHGKMTCVNWVLTEFLNYSVGAFLILVASVLGAAFSYGYSSLVLGSVFGFTGTLLMGITIRKLYRISSGSQQTSAAV
ncbi:hypothetical protein AGOR_G00039010 [Albula goreensis]|uniref:MARVEL domain-containing protein n=1 Tax=Albula goreensis TaxID=1534307 RepID=A0A8T3DY65_9TELE|nr:hypothetical protein AGOR_G00039010 [Albula goreensis]